MIVENKGFIKTININKATIPAQNKFINTHPILFLFSLSKIYAIGTIIKKLTIKLLLLHIKMKLKLLFKLFCKISYIAEQIRHFIL